jgi:hypothetical protein
MSPYRRHRTGQPRFENIASRNKHDRTDRSANELGCDYGLVVAAVVYAEIVDPI